MQAEFEDTSEFVNGRTDRQHNGQRKKDQKDKQRSTKHTHETNVE